MQSEKKDDSGRRFPALETADDFRRVAYLNDEERALGVAMAKALFEGVAWEKLKELSEDHYKMKLREPFVYWLHDPHLMRVLLEYYEPLSVAACGCTNEMHGIASTTQAGIDAVSNDPAFKRKYWTAILMVFKVAHEFRNEWWFRMVSTNTGFMDPERISVMANPASSVWTDEEALALRFTKAVVETNLTDDLFYEACTLWGAKLTVAYAHWIGFYVSLQMVYSVNVSDAERRGSDSGATLPAGAHLAPFRRPRLHGKRASVAETRDLDKRIFGLARRDLGRRSPDIITEDDAKAVPYLSDEERRLALQCRREMFYTDQYQWSTLPNHDELKKREPMLFMQHDPKNLEAILRYYDVISVKACGLTHAQHMAWSSSKGGIDTVLKDPTAKHRWWIAMLMLLKVAHEYRDEWWCRMLATCPGLVSREQVAAIEFPESSLWSEEERLALRFATAVLDSNVTDDLFNRACVRWGQKQLVAYSAWIAFYASLMVIYAVNVSDAETRTPT